MELLQVIWWSVGSLLVTVVSATCWQQCHRIAVMLELPGTIVWQGITHTWKGQGLEKRIRLFICVSVCDCFSLYLYASFCQFLFELLACAYVGHYHVMNTESLNIT